MSMVICHQCGALFDSDDDPGCFVERSEGQDVVLCEFCQNDEQGGDDDTDPWDDTPRERNAAQNADTRYKLGREHSDD